MLSVRTSSVNALPPISADAPTGDANLQAALDFLGRGFSVLPQKAGEKKPCIRWTPYQTKPPTEAEVRAWFEQQWPDAGVAVVLGPVSRLFAIDVDGKDAHDALVAKLGTEPVAPKVLSGSGDPFRYHLYFQHPADVSTRAKITPWHPKLEFKGKGAILIAPPSLHKSGNRYKWAPGRSLDDLALPEVPDAVLAALRDRTVQDQRGTGPVLALSTAEFSRAQELARSYVRKMPAAVEGQDGDRQTYTAACTLVRDFALGVDQAWPILAEYNQRCTPPWNETDLRRKLVEADKFTGVRGRRLKVDSRSDRQGPLLPELSLYESPAAEQPAKGEFVGSIPDFVQADWGLVQPRPPNRDAVGRLPRGRRSVFSGLRWLCHLEVIRQRSSSIVLPDVFAAQCVWGAPSNWPDKWRKRLVFALFQSKGRGQLPLSRKCPDACPLNGRADQPHGHLALNLPDPEAFLKCLHLFAVAGSPPRVQYDFRPPERSVDFDPRNPGFGEDRERWQAYREARNSGCLTSVYFPLLALGSSPRVGLNERQRSILIALTRETTRGARSDRKDKAKIIVRGRRTGSDDADAASCPLLEEGKPYVLFGGNDRRRRRGRRRAEQTENGPTQRPKRVLRGYRLLGRGWLERAGYEIDDDADDDTVEFEQVRNFLRDLLSLSEPFGLVAAGWHPDRREWRSAEDMLVLVHSPAGREWLRRCLLRVYTPADYLARWRAEFAQRMGFRDIPCDGEEEPSPRQAASSTTKITSAENLEVWKKQTGRTDQQIAEMAGVTRSLVSGYRSGRRPWSVEFEQKLAKMLAAQQS